MLERAEVIEMIINIFDRIDIQTPCNLDEIIEFIFNRKCEDLEDVNFGFKLWIEEK